MTLIEPMPDAFILAAGRGERLRPLTDTLPKPLIEVGGRPLIEHHLLRLADHGVQNVVVNLAWLGSLIRDAIGDGGRFGLTVRYSEEPPGALETGGGIRHALDLIGSETFFVVSGDVFADVPLELLALPPGDDMLLAMVPNPDHHPSGDFAVVDGRLRSGLPDGSNTWTYSGIGCFAKHLFVDLEPGRYPLRPLIRQSIARDQAAAVTHCGEWFDVGSPERLALARERFGD